MSPLLEVAAVTHPGKARPQNEDCIAADARAGLAVLADGMGGHNAGEVASRMAVELVASQLSQQRAQGAPLDAPRAEALIAAQVAAANATLLEAARAEPEYRGMGTTLVVAVWHDHGVSYGHVGDSRLYLLRRGELRRLTRDHSIVQEQLERGAITPEQARYAPNRNVLTRAVGIDPEVEADVCTREVEPDDVFLLCSDGLTDMVGDADIERIVAAGGGDLQGAAEELIELANRRGGVDNITVVLFELAGDEAADTLPDVAAPGEPPADEEEDEDTLTELDGVPVLAGAGPQPEAAGRRTGLLLAAAVALVLLVVAALAAWEYLS